MRRALAELPERQRVAMSLFALGEMDLRATAEAMGCAEGTVKSHLHRARAKLRVPVVRERVVYRDRPATPAAAVEVGPPEPVMPEIREVRITAKPMAVTIMHTEEVMLAPVAAEEPPADGEVGAEPDAPEGERLALRTDGPDIQRIVH
ncbi:MAG: sigma-70 family RNA polymerase sigma factor [Armatimonadota bacterium]